ncbi:heat shock transcription factor, X-linked-like isoform X2 [Lathamus discolor]|uniref:heat shock transcription factor, X-linked-like isoform X2 n=1 Tax=Lathamus discolor TaxID=678569 RepID=UPI0032B77C30
MSSGEASSASAKRRRETSARCRKPAPCAFLYTLWKLVCCRKIRSIWWGNNGSCIVIAEDLFQQEVLRWKKARKILMAENMSSFLGQLHIHGFCRMPEDLFLVTPIWELQALAAAGPALGQLLFYYHPHFQEDCPNLHKVETMAETAMEQLRAATAAPLGLSVSDTGQSRYQRGAEHGAGAAQEQRNTQPCALTCSTRTRRWAAGPTSTDTSGPSAPKRRRR